MPPRRLRMLATEYLIHLALQVTQESIDLAVPAPVIALALMRRFSSRDEYGFSDRLVAAMRNQFGGHAVKND